MRFERKFLLGAHAVRPEAGDVVEAKVTQVVDFFGALLEIQPGHEGLLHSSRMAVVAGAPDLQLTVGQTVRVRIVGRNRQGRYETTMLEGDAARHP